MLWLLVSPLGKERLGATGVGESTQANSQAEPKVQVPEEVEGEDPKPKAKARGRPRGSKNQPKAPVVTEMTEEEEEEVIVKRKPKKVVYISESEGDATTKPRHSTEERVGCIQTEAGECTPSENSTLHKEP